MKDIQIYQNRDGSLRLDVAIEEDTVWLSQQQMIKLFERDQSVISRHINSVFKEQEVDKLTNMQKLHIANSDKPVSFYSLDVIISVGYRVKSQQGVKFRQWATQTLKNYLLRGYAVDKERFTKNALELEQALALIKASINTYGRAMLSTGQEERPLCSLLMCALKVTILLTKVKSMKCQRLA